MVSVGSLRAGGSGKTPIAGHVVELLLAAGERPAILSRGYAREVERDGVTVVSDGQRLLADVREAGDEPLMLARAYPRAPVLVCANRYLAGRLAEEQLQATVHVLDDGFQHLPLRRDVDLLLADRSDLQDHLLPYGRLRESLRTAAVADALLTTEDDEAVLEQLRASLGLATTFQVRRGVRATKVVSTGQLVDPAIGPAVAFAGIARPERFFADLTRAGWTVASTVTFPDHRRFTVADTSRLADEVRRVGARVAITTSKDRARWADPTIAGVPVAVAELSATVQPPAFGDWLLARLHKARSGDAPPLAR